MKKGFTLVELIGVVVILGLISLIAIPTVTSSLKKYKASLYDDAITNIEQAARNWGAENIGMLPNDKDSSEEMTYPDIDTDSKYSTLYIAVEDLANEGFINKEIKNPKTSQLFCNKALVTIKKTSKGYTYKIEDNDYGINTLLLDSKACR